MNSTQKYDEGEAYNQSKLANVLFAKELSERLKGTGVTVNSLHPGVVDTDIVRHMWVFNSFWTRYTTFFVVFLVNLVLISCRFSF